MDGTITLRKNAPGDRTIPQVTEGDVHSTTSMQTGKTTVSTVALKPAAKKNNQIDVLVHLDGASYALSFQIPMSGQLLSGQKNMAYMKEAFSKMLSDKFGKATPI